MDTLPEELIARIAHPCGHSVPQGMRSLAHRVTDRVGAAFRFCAQHALRSADNWHGRDREVSLILRNPSMFID